MASDYLSYPIASENATLGRRPRNLPALDSQFSCEEEHTLKSSKYIFLGDFICNPQSER
jgi:hypothetical protein